MITSEEGKGEGYAWILYITQRSRRGPRPSISRVGFASNGTLAGYKGDQTIIHKKQG
jgi:hypothetical protein